MVDLKCTASKPSPDPLLDSLDLQKLAMTRGWEAKSRRRVSSWRREHLVKTKTPSVVDVDFEVLDEHRDRDLARLAAVVNLCTSCAWRSVCARWTAETTDIGH